MNQELSNFAVRLREVISRSVAAEVTRLIHEEMDLRNEGSVQLKSEPPYVGCYEEDFDRLALELFSLQFKHNSAYRKICEARKSTPQSVKHWTQIPAVPTSMFKELELSCAAPDERTAVFHSSGTTEQKPSRHFHCPESLMIYEGSLTNWFFPNVLPDFRFADVSLRVQETSSVVLTPPPHQVPHSSLAHMFETVNQALGGASVTASRSNFFGKLDDDGAWTLDFDAVMERFAGANHDPDEKPLLLLGTAFSFVHLLDFMAEHDVRFKLPSNSRVMETGGYKNRSRTMPKVELHELITERLGVDRENIICEYGMSELSSQAYDANFHPSSAIRPARVFHFPPWARVQIISPETGQEVGEGEGGLIRILDLANAFSVAAIQTEDLGVRRGGGFELVGRAQLAEPRGCSLMSV